MKKLLILVEGQTEETFVRDVLNPHFHGLDKSLVPVLVVTKRVKDGPNFKGGITSWQKVQNDLRRLFSDTSATAITTMLDYYGLPADFPGMKTRPAGSPEERVAHVERAMRDAVNEGRFIPYLALHEFEALVLASLKHAAWVFDDDAKVLVQLGAHLAGVATPEHINENAETAPSRRIIQAFPRYEKVVQGPWAVQECGLANLRQACPHFRAWVSRLEAL